MPDHDTLYRFLFEDLGIRGQWVHLDATYRAMLERHPYPPVAARLLGQATSAAALLAAIIKFDGTLTLQAQGDGAMELVLAQATAQRTLRGIAHWRAELPDGDLQALFGTGRLAVTIDPGAGGERYQGLVSLHGEDLGDALEAYFAQSEQLPTRLWLAVGERSAADMLLQELPASEHHDPDAWNRINHLADTVSPSELLELPAPSLLHRLFHEERVRLFDPEPVSFRCSCSRERIETMLVSLGEEEARQILAEQGAIEVDCEFCKQHYRFDTVDVERLFTASPQPVAPPTRH